MKGRKRAVPVPTAEVVRPHCIASHAGHGIPEADAGRPQAWLVRHRVPCTESLLTTDRPQPGSLPPLPVPGATSSEGHPHPGAPRCSQGPACFLAATPSLAGLFLSCQCGAFPVNISASRLSGQRFGNPQDSKKVADIDPPKIKLKKRITKPRLSCFPLSGCWPFLQPPQSARGVFGKQAIFSIRHK